MSERTYEEAATVLRLMIGRADREYLIRVAEDALRKAPPEHRHAARMWVDALRSGRRIKIATAEADVSLVQVDAETRQEIEEVYTDAIGR